MSGERQPSTIVIPKRVERGPTDILKVLAATVGPDYTAAHYKYHDDPYLMPTSNISKRVYALSKESGRRAARWIRDKHSEYFLHREAEPYIERFAPKLAISDDPNSVTVEDLEKAIANGDVADSSKIYELLVVSGKEIEPKTLQSLLELLCYFNNQPSQDEEFLEERWFTVQTQSKEMRKKTWKDGSLADELFNALPEPKSAEAYSAIVRGMSKYFQVEKAWALFQEAQKKQLVLDTEAYNAILRVVTSIREGPEKCWDMIMELLAGMRQASLKPNLGTMNAILESISALGAWRQRREIALSVLAEFSKLNVKPSLGSYYLLMNIFYKERGGLSTILYDIVEELEKTGVHADVLDPKDTNFFITAMDIANSKLNDVELGNRLHALLMTGRNYDFIGDSFKESIYYRNFFSLLNQSLAVDDFMDNYYEKLVPFVYTPEPSVMLNVLKSVDLGGSAVRYLPRLWSDMIVFDHVNRQNLVEAVARMLADHVGEEEDASAMESFLGIARDVWDRIEGQKHERSVNFITWTGDMLGDLLKVFGKCRDLNYATQIMNRLREKKHDIAGMPHLVSLQAHLESIFEALSEKKDDPNSLLAKAVDLVCYAHDCTYLEAREMALKLGEKFTFNTAMRDKINSSFGEALYPEPVEEIVSEEELYRRKMKAIES